jgi:calmodulin-binding transcription activator
MFFEPYCSDCNTFLCHKIAGNYQGQHATQNKSFYPVNQHNGPLILNGSSDMLGTNGRANQTDLPSWNSVIELDEPGQMPHLQFPVPSDQGATTEGLGVDYLTFDEVYSDGLSLNDIGAAGTHGKSYLQVCWSIIPCIDTYEVLSV